MTGKILVIAGAVALSGCTTLGARPDGICPEIADFANAIPDGEERTVRLETAWGSGLDGSEGLLFEKQCEHADYGPAKPLCRYLIEETSTEFMELNISRVLACFPGSPPFRQVAGVSVQHLDGVISTWSFAGVKAGTKVTVGFSTGCQDCDPHLEITAERPGDSE